MNSTSRSVPISRASSGVEVSPAADRRGGRTLMTGLKWSQLRGWDRLTDAPVCVSLNTMPKRRFPSPRCVVAVDGGAFGTMDRLKNMSEEEHALFVSSWGVPWSDEDHFFATPKEKEWRPQAHVLRARRALEGIGRLRVAWIGPQDMMCEPFMLRRTGLTVEEHQCRTVANYVELCRLAPDVPWLPVVQGWVLADYLRCVEMYREAGVDLTEVEWVGVGSVCKRQSTREGVEIIVALLRLGLRVHAFGFKLDGLKALRSILTDEEWSRLRADSAAWSKHAWKKRILMPGHFHGAITKNCANCVVYANERRGEIEAAIG